MKQTCFLILVAALVFAMAGCSGQNPETGEQVEPEPPAIEGMEPEPEPEPAAETPEEPAEEPKSIVEPEPEPVVAPEPASENVAPPSTEPPALIEVGATKDGLTRVGDAKCKVCHKIQHASWAGSSHAALNPVLDCESCHGPGSEYKKMSIMKNRELAIAAGLVLPEAGFCTASCHSDDWKDSMLSEAHEKKPAS